MDEDIEDIEEVVEEEKHGRRREEGVRAPYLNSSAPPQRTDKEEGANE